MLEFLRKLFGVFSDPEVYKDPIEDVSKELVLDKVEEEEPETVVDLSTPKDGPFPSWSEEAMKSVTQPSKYFK